ncbi:hypothetical protein BDR03DRAFT_933945 [Suillus americanus]|nr:hypothetical protein BDR03DRAFT_933945 [Suillus americanus]
MSRTFCRRNHLSLLVYQRVPTFGQGTIRRFNKNASAMKHLAACDFKDLLQCTIPNFQGLLPSKHNKIVLDLLFDLATWHAYAKLHLHTDGMLAFFDSTTIVLSRLVRKFMHTTCKDYVMTKLPQEHAARSHHQAALASKQLVEAATGRSVKGKESVSNMKVKKLNLYTYKYHALADYPNTIWRIGTTDSYSTQPVSALQIF